MKENSVKYDNELIKTYNKKGLRCCQRAITTAIGKTIKLP